MRTMHVLAQHHRVHDRQNARAAVIIALDVFIVREQARDRRRAFVKKLRDVERQQRVELTRREHPLQRLPPGEEIEPDVARPYGRYAPSALYPLLRYINLTLRTWVFCTLADRYDRNVCLMGAE